MMKYVSRIKAKINIYASKKTSNLFDGSYKSIYTGNGFDFENLREYIPGDNIRDIDWKASSRSRNILVKRYVAERKHNLLLVFDAGIRMNAHTKQLQSKKETALYAGGTIGYLAGRNGDNLSAIYCCDDKVSYYPFRTGLQYLEQILTAYDHQELAMDNDGLEKSLSYIIKHMNRKMIVVVITDAAGIHGISEETLKKLMGLSDVLFVSISDAEITSGKAYDISRNSYVPEFIFANRKLKKIEQEQRKKVREENERKLLKYRIVSIEIDGEEEMAEKITELLERHKYAGNR